MTNKQLELKAMMQEMVNDKYAEYFTNGETEVYKASKDHCIAYLIIQPDDFKMYTTTERCGSHWNKLKQIGPRSYFNFETTVENIERLYKREEAEEERSRKYQEKVKANLNNPATFKNDYLDQLLKENRNKKCSWAINTILYSYEHGRVNGNTEFIIDDIRGCSNNPETVQEIDETLTTAGINEFVYTETSSAAMMILNYFMDLDWKIKTNYHKTIKAQSMWDIDQEIFGMILSKEV